MGCNSPLTAYKGPGGKITFKAKEGYYDLPLQLACGRCRGCRLRRTRDWAIRAVHEAQMHEQNCFLTLTYNDKHLPEDHGLNVKHWQDFAKRLRKTGKFRYLHCGEYGEDKLRPHYHACIFGRNFHKDSIPTRSQNGHPYWISAEIADAWEWGFHTIGELCFDTAAYVASYVFKQINGDLVETKNTRVDPTTGETWTVTPEYATMSRNKGLGHSWFEKYASDLYPHDFAVVNGQKFRPPKYYDQQLEKTQPELWKKIAKARQEHVRKQPEELTPERLQVKETIIQAKWQAKAHTKNLA